MTCAAAVELRIQQGATFRKRFVWKASPLLTPVDLTGYAARMQVRDTVAAPAFLVELTTANGGITLGGATGTIDLLLTAAQTSAFAWTVGVWDLELVAPNGDVRRLVSGVATVSPEITR